MTIQVRAATRHDANAITDVHVASWRHGYSHIFVPAELARPDFEDVRRQYWTAWRLSPGERVYVAGTPNRADRSATGDAPVAAFCSFGPERDRGAGYSGRGEINSLYVHPDAWGSGVADALIEAVDARLRSDGFAEAVLWVLGANSRARRFYARHGWAATGVDDRFTAYGATVSELEYRKEFLHVPH